MFRNFCEFFGKFFGILRVNFCEFWLENSRNFCEFSAKFGKIHGICEFFGVNLGVAKNSRKFGGEICEFLGKFKEIHAFGAENSLVICEFLKIKRGENV